MSYGSNKPTDPLSHYDISIIIKGNSGNTYPDVSFAVRLDKEMIYFFEVQELEEKFGDILTIKREQGSMTLEDYEEFNYDPNAAIN